MKNGWFYKLLFSYLPVFLVITSLLVVISFATMFSMSKNTAKEANEAFTQYAMQVLDHSLRSIDQALYKEIETNEQFKQFFYNVNNNSTYYTLYQPYQKLNDIKLASPLIDSVYLYRVSDQSVLSTSMLVSLDDFGDKGFLLEMMQHSNSFQWTGRREYQERSEHTPKQVVSLVNKIPIFSGSQGLIIVNIRVDAIKNMLSDMSNANISYIHLFDRAGSSILGEMEDQSQFGENGDILASLSSNYTGWEVQSGYKNWNSLEMANKAFILLAVFSIVAIAAGMVWVVLATRRNYRPIESITMSINSFMRQKSGALLQKSGKDEFKFIESALHNMIEQSNQYLQQHEESLTLRRQYFFHELIEGDRTIEPEEFVEEMKRYQLPSTFHQCEVSLLELDHYTDFCKEYSVQDQNLFKFILTSVVIEISQLRKEQIWMEWVTGSRLSIIFFFDKEVEANQIKNIYGQYMEWIHANLTFTITIGIGSRVYQISDFSEAFDHALEALNYKPVLGSDQIIEFSKVRELDQGKVYSQLESIRELSKVFRLGQEQWKDQLEELFQELNIGMFSRKDIVSMMNYLIYYFQWELLEMSEELKEVWDNETLSVLHTSVEHFETVDDLHKAFHTILVNVFDKMNEMRQKNGHYALMLKVKAYIQEHFANPDLSLVHLSEAFSISAKYLSLLFKEEGGEKFVDYLVRIRLEQAKKLLIDTEETVQDIASKVGYIHSFSFIRVFKKQVGMTPGDYRKEMGSNHHASE